MMRALRVMNRLDMRLLVAAMISLGGTALVFQLLDWMNRPAPPPTQRAARPPVEFSVTPEPKRQNTPRVSPKVQPQRRVNQPRAPLPTLSTALSGISFGIPALTSDVLADAQDSLLGSEAALDEVVMTAKTVDELPRMAQQVSPRYPPRARAEGITGHVKLRLLVGQDGRVEDAKVVEAEPRGIFEEAAVTAIRQCVFSPARYRGKQVKMWAEQVMHFNLG